MKVKKPLCCLALGIASLMGGGELNGASLFQEDFESDVYPLDLPVPLDYGVINYGAWSGIPPESRPGIVIEGEGSRVLQLKALPGFSRGTRVIGVFGWTNQERAKTDEAVRVRFRFNFSASLGETFYFMVLGSDGRAKAMLSMDESGTLLASFGGKREPVGGVLRENHWYNVEIQLPAKPRTKSRYEVILSDGEEQIGVAKGDMARSMEAGEGDYSSLDIQHRCVNETLLIDDIVVETSGE